MSSTFFEPSFVPPEIWVDLILDNDFTFHELFQFGLVCRFFSQLLKKPQIQNLKFTKKKTGEYMGHKSSVNDVQWSPDGLLLASCDYTTILLWDIRTGKEIKKFAVSETIFFFVDFHPHGKLLASGGSEKCLDIQIWDISTGEKSALGIKNNENYVYYSRFHPSGEMIGSCGNDETGICLWNIETGELIKKLKGHTECPAVIYFDSHGFFCYSIEGPEVIVFEVSTGLEKWSQNFDELIWGLALSPDDKLLAVLVPQKVSRLYEIHIFDTSTFQLQNKISHMKTIFCLCFDATSKFLCYSQKKKIIVYDLVLGTQKTKLIGHTGRVNFLSVCPDRNFLASCSKDHTIRVWDLENYL